MTTHALLGFEHPKTLNIQYIFIQLEGYVGYMKYVIQTNYNNWKQLAPVFEEQKGKARIIEYNGMIEWYSPTDNCPVFTVPTRRKFLEASYGFENATYVYMFTSDGWMYSDLSREWKPLF